MRGTERAPWKRATLATSSGALSGMMLGAALASRIPLGSDEAPLGALVFALPIGALLGAVVAAPLWAVLYRVLNATGTTTPAVAACCATGVALTGAVAILTLDGAAPLPHSILALSTTAVLTILAVLIEVRGRGPRQPS